MLRFIFMSMLLAAVLTGHAEGLRIVSLAASITQNLYFIGANEELVGCTRFCLTNPEDKIPVVADAVNVNLEKIVALQPDLVVAGGLTSPKTLEALERMGIQSIRLNQPKDFEEICGQCLKLGEISGHSAEAKAIVAQACEQLAAAKRNIDPSHQPKVFMEIGRNPLFAAVPGSFMNDYIVQAGGKNIAAGLKSGSTSREFVLLNNPDVIFVVGMGIVGEEEIEAWKKIRSLAAVRDGKVFPLDQYICSPTPLTFVETVEEIIRLMKNKE